MNDAGPGRLHLDVAPTTDSDQETEVARLLTLGATTAAAEDPRWVTLADPNGNELRVRPRPDPSIGGQPRSGASLRCEAIRPDHRS